jgi:hypothetical protein
MELQTPYIHVYTYCDMTPEIRNSEVRKTVIARQRRVETHFRSNEYSGINQRVTQRLVHVLMETANNKEMNCCAWCSISGRREASSGRDTESRDRVRYREFEKL